MKNRFICCTCDNSFNQRQLCNFLPSYGNNLLRSNNLRPQIVDRKYLLCHFHIHQSRDSIQSKPRFPQCTPYRHNYRLLKLLKNYWNYTLFESKIVLMLLPITKTAKTNSVETNWNLKGIFRFFRKLESFYTLWSYNLNWAFIWNRLIFIVDKWTIVFLTNTSKLSNY